jgi:hypothetical protein
LCEFLSLILFLVILAAIDERLVVGFVVLIVVLMVINGFFPQAERDSTWCYTGDCCRDLDGNWGPCH